MAAPTQTQRPSSTPGFESLNAYQRTATLNAAIELDFFTGIGERNTTSKSLAERRRLHIFGV